MEGEEKILLYLYKSFRQAGLIDMRQIHRGNNW